MYINLRFSEEQCDELLSKIGYKTEITTLYFYKDSDPYGRHRELSGLDWKVTYKGEKPKKLCAEYPLLEECREYLHDNVTQKIISEWIFKMMLDHPLPCENN